MIFLSNEILVAFLIEFYVWYLALDIQRGISLGNFRAARYKKRQAVKESPF